MQSVVTYWVGFSAITWREIAKFMRQTERLISAIVRPALWLIVFAAGLHDILGVSIVPPYSTYVPYQEYVLPGLIGVVVLFQCMQSALSMVYDREAGVMRAQHRGVFHRGCGAPVRYERIAAVSLLPRGYRHITHRIQKPRAHPPRHRAAA